jgi:hypothetical protein
VKLASVKRRVTDEERRALTMIAQELIFSPAGERHFSHRPP